ncbi:MAG: hypothetical protein J6U04_09225, partial [Salinivirgaceae bacterium]|nr:hypothetical protein [Salinivirgaceae bacterium]
MNIRTLSTIACVAGLMALASCSNNNNTRTTIGDDGHLLWFNSLQMEAPATLGLTTLQIAQENIAKYWKSDRKVELKLNSEAAAELGKEGFEIDFSGANICASANSEVGLLYASYELLRLQETDGLAAQNGKLTSVPAFERRVLNHWDN